MTPRSPGPPYQPNTFWAPCAKKMTPRTTRTIRRDFEANVPKSMSIPSPLGHLEGRRLQHPSGVDAGGRLGGRPGPVTGGPIVPRVGLVRRHLALSDPGACRCETHV